MMSDLRIQRKTDINGTGKPSCTNSVLHTKDVRLICIKKKREALVRHL